MESRLWMSPTLILTFYGWGTGPQEIRLLFQGHGELHNHEANASVVPKFIYVPSRWLKKKKIFTESYLKKGKKKRPESARFMFFPTKQPDSWTTGALELIIASLWAFDPLPTEPRTAQMPPTALSHPMQLGLRMHPGMRPKMADITHKAASSACDPLGWPFNSRLLGL